MSFSADRQSNQDYKEQPAPVLSCESKNRDKLYRGEVAYVYAYDLAYDMKRHTIDRILSQPTREYLIAPSKRSPRQMFFYCPQVADFPPQTKQLADGQAVQIKRSIKLFNIGAISVQVRVPFAARSLEELVKYHGLQFADGVLDQEINEFAEAVRRDLEPHCIRPVPMLGQAEAYTVFCLADLPQADSGQHIVAEQWLKANRREIAALLTQEENAAHLSEQEVVESTERYISYYDRELVLVDWDATLVVGQEDDLDDVLHIIELANVQLVELAAYDRILDDALQVSYRDISQMRFHSRREVHKKLREIRIDVSRLDDELSNITKFFGDWYLAQIHANLASRFHLPDWHRTIDEKLETLHNLYQILQQDRFDFLMFVLEATIVLLFVIDLLLLLFHS
jgi:hypothetical protein